jgi:hypothetical protein
VLYLSWVLRGIQARHSGRWAQHLNSSTSFLSVYAGFTHFW